MNKFLIVFLLLIFAGTSFTQTIKVETLTKTKLTKLINDRNDKILFINVWATWCVPCREEFPDIVKLTQLLKGKQIDFFGISIDYPEEVKSKIIPFLKSNKATFKNYVSGFKNDEELINILDKNWNGALPATFVFNSNGEKVKTLEGKKSFSQFEEALKENL
jgi:thiol-disulfide isomerase/thioredoxin